VWHPEYVIEAALLGGFMVSALAFTVWLEHPASPLRAAVTSALVRRMLIGAGMGATAVVLIYSGWGQRSGAHMNPAVTLAFARLGLVSRGTATGYIVSQFIGGLIGVAVARALLGPAVAHAAVRFAITTPAWGTAPAFSAELAMTTLLMGAVLAASRAEAWRPHAGLVAAGCVAAFITVEAPVSGMSLNPARTLASAVWAWEFTGLWIYFLAPALGMLLAAEIARHLHPPAKDAPCSTTT
jgi:aquaporin Z